MTSVYSLRLITENPIPPDVLMEHLGYTIRTELCGTGSFRLVVSTDDHTNHLDYKREVEL